MSRFFVAAAVLTLSSGRALPGEVVDVSGWAPEALAASLAIGQLRIRVGAEVFQPAPFSSYCPMCALPYASWGDVEQHGRHVHGWAGGKVATAPEPALVRVPELELPSGQPEPGRPAVEIRIGEPVAILVAAPRPEEPPPRPAALAAERPASTQPEALACPHCPGRVFKTAQNLQMHLDAHAARAAKAAA